MGVEKLLGLEVPKKVEYMRVLVAELNRINSHLLWLAAYGLDMGAFTPFLYAFRDREEINVMIEEASGGRLTTQLLPRRRVRPRPPEGVLPAAEEVHCQVRRGRERAGHAPGGERHLRGPHEGRRRHRQGPGDLLRDDGPLPARLGCPVRRAARHARTRSTGHWISRSRSAGTATPGTGPG